MGACRGGISVDDASEVCAVLLTAAVLLFAAETARFGWGETPLLVDWRLLTSRFGVCDESRLVASDALLVVDICSLPLLVFVNSDDLLFSPVSSLGASAFLLFSAGAPSGAASLSATRGVTVAAGAATEAGLTSL